MFPDFIPAEASAGAAPPVPRTRTTQLYNRLQEEISLDEIERIHI